MLVTVYTKKNPIQKSVFFNLVTQPKCTTIAAEDRQDKLLFYNATFQDAMNGVIR